jgi:Holliday junction resolvase RusA-like endonuclease
MTIDFVIPGEPPRVTAQGRRMRIVNGKPVFFKTKAQKEAEALYYYHTLNALPHGWKPMEKPVRLFVAFCFGTDDKREVGTWKTTRPDTDNMLKALKDVMTEAGVWVDDSQVVDEHTTKSWWSRENAGIHVQIEELEENV